MTTPGDWNEQVIREFRANKGRVAQFGNGPVLLLTARGAKSGVERVTPLVYLPDGDRLLIFGSMGGAPKHPAWYHNLVANPTARVEVGDESFEADAEVLTGAERDAAFARQVAAMPMFGDYQAKTTRTIPVVALRRRA